MSDYTSPFSTLISHSAELDNLIRTAQIAASADITVLIQGETGTGKELLAQAMHAASHRDAQAMLTMNCAALNESRIESLIFGHVEGAFEGAVSDAEGYLQAADRSTLFLDEIGELNLAGQACLLRFLESGESQKVGSSEVEHFDVRILAATHQNLQQLVNEGSFREDLFYRLNVVTLELPPLRQRTSDIPDLLRHFTMAYALEQNKSALQFDRSAMRRLQQHDWPGNVRQLRNLAARLVTLKPDNSILNADDIANELAVQSSSLDSSVYELPAEGIRLEEIEIDLIKQALNKTGGNKSQAARLLGISRDAFLYRLKKHQLDA